MASLPTYMVSRKLLEINSNHGVAEKHGKRSEVGAGTILPSVVTEQPREFNEPNAESPTTRTAEVQTRGPKICSTAETETKISSSGKEAKEDPRKN
ncbi:unnamed protein product [Linum trigynum]|uniref:Uncharacterized protein n=1 Tax=Linum trigynum TaxID=586398 RepID=A0AAV2CDY0_9ROSI